MDGLERVRKAITDYVKNPSEREALAELDAHLKEDAELREANERFRERIHEQSAELTRLREMYENMSNMAASYSTEIDRLREKLEHERHMRWVEAGESGDKSKELARLRQENERYRASHDGRFEDIISTLRDTEAQRDDLLAGLKAIEEIAAFARATIAKVES